MPILVKTCDKEFEIENVAEKELSEILYDSGLILNKRCAGDGLCGGCLVIVESGNYISGDKKLKATSKRHRNVLSCKTYIKSKNSVVKIPSRSRIEVNGSIEGEFVLGEYNLNPTIQKINIIVPKPSLSDHRCDQERIAHELYRISEIENIIFPLNIIQKLSRFMNNNINNIAVTIANVCGNWKIIRVEENHNTAAMYGVALDIGTTTVAGILIDLETGKILHRASRYNQQLVIADDVASRISAAKSDKIIERLKNLLILDTINPIIDSVCHAQEIETEQINRISIAGNTVMMHLLLGLDVRNIGRFPFNPVIKNPVLIVASELGINANINAPVDIIPAIAGYVGGDITADIYVTDMLSQTDGTMLLDLGTNGEIVLKDKGQLFACASPAGPAFEGGGLLYGCRATEGAIERIRITDALELTFDCIGNAKPKGLCGTAIIDFIADGYRSGLINKAGRMDVTSLKSINRYCQIDLDGKQTNACIVVPVGQAQDDNPVVITEADIAEILQAKAAIYAAIKTLLEYRGLTFENIQEFILAGGFAKHLDIKNSIEIGLLPDLNKNNFSVIGNGALAGAFLSLVDNAASQQMATLHKIPEVLELNLEDGFEVNFIEGLFLPEKSTCKAINN